MRKVVFAQAVIAFIRAPLTLAICGLLTPGEIALAQTQFQASQYLQAPATGMAQYTVAMQQSTSPSATLQALGDWNTYVVSRSETGLALTSTLLNRLAAADWNARQAGAAQITAQQIATAATNLVNAKLATMTASQQQSLFEQCMSTLTPKGRFGLNSGNPYVSATQGSDGRWTVTISPDAFSTRKTFFNQKVSGMMSSSANFYPAEAIVILYSVATDDMGFGGSFPQSARKAVSDLTGLEMSSQYLFGPNGYLARRPLSTFFTEQSMSQFFSALGF